MVHDVVGRVAHPEQGAGRVQVTGHAGPRVHVLTQTLEQERVVFISYCNMSRNLFSTET